MANRKKKKGVNLVGSIITIIIVISIIVFIVNLIKKNQNNDKKQEDNKEYVKILEDDTKINISPKVNENKKINTLEVTDIKLTYKNGITNLLATVKNTKNEKIKMMNVEIQLIDEEGNMIYSWPGIIEEAEPGETVQLNSSITADFVNVYDIKIVEK